VIVAASDAMSRLGEFEAALEILPRMHLTDSPVLQRQFAIAMGNLLGKPGEFYVLLTGDANARSVALERLQQDAQRNLQNLVALASKRKGPAEARDGLHASCRKLRDAIAAADHVPLIKELHATLLNVSRLLAGRAFSEDEALGFAFMHDAKLGLGLWFASEVQSRLETLRGTDLLETDALLAMYFLSAYKDDSGDEEE
jgi:hypothetical protein